MLEYLRTTHILMPGALGGSYFSLLEVIIFSSLSILWAGIYSYFKFRKKYSLSDFDNFLKENCSGQSELLISQILENTTSSDQLLKELDKFLFKGKVDLKEHILRTILMPLVKSIFKDQIKSQLILAKCTPKLKNLLLQIAKEEL